MQDHGVGQTIGTVGRRFTEAGAVDGGHDGSGLVADHLGIAVVLVRGGGRDIEHAMAEGAERDAGVAQRGLVRQHDFEDGDVADDGRRDGGHEQEDAGEQEEDHADPVR